MLLLQNESKQKEKDGAFNLSNQKTNNKINQRK